MSRGLFFLLTLTVQTALGQTVCIHDNLSTTWRFTTVTRKLKLSGPNVSPDTGLVIITIIDKLHRRPVQVIQQGISWITRSYFNCNAVRSYTTSKNGKPELASQDSCWLAVADFNFDGRDDFAVKTDMGASIIYYAFYLQEPDGRFTQNKFLTQNMQCFPQRFNFRNHTLTTLQTSTVRYMAEDTYQLNLPSGRWRLIKHRLLAE